MSKRTREALAGLVAAPLSSTSSQTNPTNSLGYAANLNENNVNRVMQSAEYLQDLADFYWERDGKSFANTDEMIDYARSDRRWRNLNTISIGRDIFDANTMNDQQSARMARIQAVYDASPAFFSEGGDGWAGFGEVAAATLVDPINLVGFGSGGAAAKAAAAGATRSGIARGIGGEALKREARSAGLRAGAASGFKSEAIVGGAVEAVHDQAIQRRNVELGLQDEVSYGQTALSAGLGAATGGVLGAGFGMAGAVNPLRRGGRSNIGEGMLEGANAARRDAVDARIDMEIESGEADLPARGTPEEKVALTESIKARTRQMDQEFIDQLDAHLAERGENFDMETDLFDVDVDEAALTQGQRINLAVDRMNDLQAAADTLRKSAQDVAAKGDPDGASPIRARAEAMQAASDRIANQLRRVHNSKITTDDAMIAEVEASAAASEPLLLEYNPDAPSLRQMPDGSPVRDLTADEKLQKRAIMPEVKVESQPIGKTNEAGAAAQREALGTQEGEQPGTSRVDEEVPVEQPEVEVEPQTELAIAEERAAEAKANHDKVHSQIAEEYRQYKAAKERGAPAETLSNMYRRILAKKPDMEFARKTLADADQEVARIREAEANPEGSSLEQVAQNEAADAASRSPNGEVAQEQFVEELDVTPESLAETIEVTNPAILEQLEAFYDLGLAQPKKYYERLLKKMGDGRKPEIKAKRREFLLGELRRAVAAYQHIEELEAATSANPDNIFQIAYHRASIELISDDPQIVSYVQDFYSRTLQREAKALFLDRFATRTYTDAMDNIREEFGDEVLALVAAEVQPGGQSIGTAKQWSAMAKDFFAALPPEQRKGFEQREAQLIQKLMKEQGFNESEARSLARERIEMAIDKANRANDPLKDSTRTIRDYSVSDAEGDNARHMGAARRQGLGTYTVFGKEVKGGDAMKKAAAMLRKANRHGFTGQLVERGVKVSPDGKLNHLTSTFTALEGIYRATVDRATNRLVTDPVLMERNAQELEPIDELLKKYNTALRKLKKVEKEAEAAEPVDVNTGEPLAIGSPEYDAAIERLMAPADGLRKEIADYDAQARKMLDTVFFKDVDEELGYGKTALQAKRKLLTQNTEKGAAGNRMEKALTDADMNTIKGEIASLKAQLKRAINSHQKTGKSGMSDERMEEIMNDIQRLTATMDRGANADKALRKRMKTTLRQERIADAVLRGEEIPTRDFDGDITPEDAAAGRAQASEVQRKAAAEKKYSQRITEADLRNMTKDELIQFYLKNKEMLNVEIKATKTPEVAPATTKHMPRVVEIEGLLVDVNNDFKYKKTGNGTFDVYLDGKKIGRGEKVASGYVYDNGTDKFFHPNANDMLDALPRRHINQIKDIQKRTSIFDETAQPAPQGGDFTHPDWRHTDSYADEAPVPAASKPDPIENAAPASDPNDPLSFSEADYDIPSGRKLAVQIIDPAAGKQMGAVRVFSYKNQQTLGGILKKAAEYEYVVGTVEHGMTSSKMGARETFRPLNADDPFIPVNGKQPIKARELGAEQMVSKRARINKPTNIEKLQGKIVDNPPQWAIDEGIITAADLYGYVENLDKIDWKRIPDVESYRNFMQVRMEAGMLMNQYAPNGVSRPVATAKKSISELARVLEGRADDEIQAAQDFIVRLAGHNRDKAPLFTHGTGDSKMMGVGNGTGQNQNRIIVGEGSLIMDENGQRHIPVTATIIHEIGHWIYFNLLEEADKMRFWDAMGKYYNDDGVNVEMLRRKGHLGDGVASNDLESPGEFFANQFMTYAVNGGQVNNLSMWQKVARMASILIRRLTGDDGIKFDADLLHIFQKYMPVLDVDPDSLVDNGGISRFAHLEQLGKEHGKGGGNTAALAGKMLHDHDVQRVRMRTVLNTSSYETADALGLVNELQRIQREIYGAYGGKQHSAKHKNYGKDGHGSTRVRLLDGTYEVDRLMKTQYAIHDFIRELREAGAITDTRDGTRGSLTLSDESLSSIGDTISKQEVEFEGFSSWDAQMAQMMENNSSLGSLETKAVMHLHKLANEMMFAIDGAMKKHIQIYKRNMKKSARQEGVLVDLFDGTITTTGPSQKSLYYMRKAKQEAAKELEEYFGIEGLQAEAQNTKFVDADANPDPILNEAPSKMNGDELAAESKATLDDVKRVADLGNEMQGRNNTRAKSVDELIEELDEQGREIYDAIRADEEVAHRVLRSAMEMTRNPETASRGRVYMQIATKVLQDFGVDNPAPIKNGRVAKAVKRLQEKEVGTDNENGILHGASPALKEHTAGLTHRDKRTEYVMRQMFQRMAELFGIDEQTPFTEYEATVILGFDPKGADDSVPLRTDSNMYNVLRKHMREMAQQLRNGEMAVFNSLGEMHYAGMAESERKLFDEAANTLGITGQEFFNNSHIDFLNGEGIALPYNHSNPATLKRIVEDRAQESTMIVNKLTDGEAFKSKPQFMAYGDVFASGRVSAPIIAASDSVNKRFIHPAIAGKYAAELPKRMSERVQTAVREFLGLKPDENISSKVFFNGGNGNGNGNGITVTDGDFGTGIYVKKADMLNKTYDPVEAKADLLSFLDETGVSGQAKVGGNDAINMIIALRERISRISNQASPAQRQVVQDLLRMEARQWRILEEIHPAFGFYGNKVQPVFADMRNTFDLSGRARYSIVGNQQNNVAYLIDRMADSGMIDPQGTDYLRRVLTDEFTGLDLYTVLTHPDVGVMHKRGNSLNATHAKADFLAFMSEEGFDSLEIDDGFLVLHESAIRHVKDGFRESDAKNHAPSYIAGDHPMPVAQVAEEMAYSNADIPRGMGVGVIAEAQRLGMPDTLAKPLRKMLRKDDLNPVDVDRVGVFSTVKNYFSENSNYLRSLGANWMGDILKPRKGFGIFEKHDVELNNILAPIFGDLLKLPDNKSGFNRWARANEGLLFRNTRQPASHTRIISALRQGRSAVQKLPTEERRIALKIAKAFDAELNKMREMGIKVGDTRNYGLDYYVPQVWDKEAILSNPNKFKRALFNYLMNEQRAPNFEGNAKSSKEITDLVDELFMRMTASDGVLDTVDILRNKVSDPFQRRMLRLKPGDVKAMDEFLVNDLNGILAKYFDRTVRKRALTEKLGVSGHGLEAYKAVALQGRKAAVDIMMSTKKMGIMNNTLQGIASTENVIVPKLSGTSKDISALIDSAHRLANSGPSGKSKATALLINAIEPEHRNNPQYLVRVDAVVNAMSDFPQGGASHKVMQKIDAMNNVLNKRPIDGTSGTETKHKFVRNLKAFNSVSLLGFTTLTSIPDLALPLIRSGNLGAFARAWKNYSTDPNYRQAAKNIGVGIENLLHDRMVQMGGEGSQKFTNAFFNFTLLTPWTNLNREVAAMVGYEAFRSELSRAISMKQRGDVNSKAYQTTMRFLERYGLTGEGASYDFLARGAFAVDRIPANKVEIQDQLKAAILRFTNESIFTPNPNDIPMWAQTPWGGLMFQLKSFPLMMSRLSADVLREAGKGNIKPLAYMATAGVGLGMLSVGLKDIIQSRGGEDGESMAFRERLASKLIPIEEGGDYDERLGWYLEGLMAMGGLGLFAELLYNTSAQLDNGKYGYVRAMSGIFGPAVSASEAAFDVTAGAADFAFGDGETLAKRRQALRQIASRIPVAGGVNAFRETAADLAGEAGSGGSSAASWSKFGR